MIKDFKLNKVHLDDEYYINALNKEISYLMSFDNDRLVAGFREVKGLTPKAEKYPGWEVTEIRGHSIGHYMTAISQAYAQTEKKEILDKINELIDELYLCQLENGYLSAFPEILFDNVENKKPCWVPWYTMDKIISGLTAAYVLAGNEKAFDIVKKLGVWVYERVSKWSKETQDTVLAVEYGGMNEAMYDLFRYSGDERYEKAAHAFDEMALFEELHNNHDILNGKHANTTIPKILGALYRYIVRGCKTEDRFYFETAERFFDIVVNNHTYITGGNSEWEHFGEPKVLDKERTNCNCETCNTYNMLKLSRELFKITGNKKYSDFYENTFINAIMSSQNPETGMTMYFQPMATGYFKVYSTPFNSFWCCTGTGMENFTKCNDSVYFYDDRYIYVNQFISSKVEYNGAIIQQISSIPEKDSTTFVINKAIESVNFAIRIPDWSDDRFELSVVKDGEIATCSNENTNGIKVIDGYIYVDGLNEKDEITVTFSLKIKAYGLPDNNHSIAMKYGPVVLSAALGTEDMAESKTGVDVTIATKNISIKDFITIPSGEIDEYIENIQDNIKRNGQKLEFSMIGTDSDKLVFTPHYRQHKERYGIYWNMVSKNSEALMKHIYDEKNKRRLEKVSIDSIPLGNDQYELLHNIKGENTGAGTFNGLQLRHAWGENGWFAYDMKVKPGEKNYILAKYFGPNQGRTFNIYINDELLCEETIEDINNGDFYDKKYLIPEKYLTSDIINVKFKVRGHSWVGGVFDRLCIIKNYNNNPYLSEILVNGGKMDKTFKQDILDYSLSLCENINSIAIKITPHDSEGLIYVNDILIDDSQLYEMDVQSGQIIKIKSYAEDFETFKEYSILVK